MSEFISILSATTKSGEDMLLPLIIIVLVVSVIALALAIKNLVGGSSDDKSTSGVVTASKPVDVSSDDEIVAVIAAAVAAFSAEDGKNYVVKSITPLPTHNIRKPSKTLSSWSMSGRLNNIGLYTNP